MPAGLCRVIAALALVIFATAAVAQPVIPPSAQPGRERERFTEPPAPLAEPGGQAISLPSTVAPKGADHINVLVHGVQIVGMTVYTQEQIAPLYADMIGHEVTLQAVYDLAQKITTKYGNDGFVISRAIVPPQQLNPGGATIRIQVIEGYVDKVEWPAALDKFRDFFTYYTSRITAQRPANIHTIERYLLLAGDLPGLKFKNSLKPSAANQGAATLIVEVTTSPFDWAARIDNRGPPGQGPLEFLASVTVNNLLRMHDAFTFSYAGPFKPEELKYIFGQYSQVLNAEGFAVLRRCQRRLGTAGAGAGLPGDRAELPDQERGVRDRTDVSLDPHPRAQPVDHIAGLRVQQRRVHAGGPRLRPQLERPAARRPLQGQWRLGRSVQRHQPGQYRAEQGLQRRRQHRERRRSGEPPQRPGRFLQAGDHLHPGPAIAGELLVPAGRLWPIGRHAAPQPGNVRVRRAGVRPRL